MLSLLKLHENHHAQDNGQNSESAYDNPDGKIKANFFLFFPLHDSFSQNLLDTIGPSEYPNWIPIIHAMVIKNNYYLPSNILCPVI